MKTINKFYSIAVLLVIGAMSAQAVSYGFTAQGKKTDDGYFLWSDAKNFSPAGAPGSSDAVSLGMGKNNKLQLTDSVAMLSLTARTAAGTVRGADSVTLTLSNYIFMPADTLLTLESANVVVGNAIRFSGAKAVLTLSGGTRLRAGMRIDAANTTISLILKDQAVYEGLAVPSVSAGATLAGGSISLSDDSALKTGLNAAQVDNNYLSKKVVLTLNGNALVKFSPAAENSDRIARCIKEGKILINGKSSAVLDSDYTYDAATGILQVKN